MDLNRQNFIYPTPITVHLYQCHSLHEGMNPKNIQDANLPEYDSFTANSSEELDSKWNQIAIRTGTCGIVETKEGIVCGGIGGPDDWKIWLSQYFEKQKEKSKS